MARIIQDEDVPIVIEALRHATADRRAFIDTLGKDDPPEVKEKGLARADEWERIANELSI